MIQKKYDEANALCKKSKLSKINIRVIKVTINRLQSPVEQIFNVKCIFHCNEFSMGRLTSLLHEAGRYTRY